jgi:hypothetical protein
MAKTIIMMFMRTGEMLAGLPDRQAFRTLYSCRWC